MTASAQPALKSVVRKITIRLLPILLLMYVLAYLDRANLGFAKDSFLVDTGISEAAYALGAGIFFLGYAVFEVPSNMIMRRVGAKIWLARIMVTWGIVSALMMFAQNEVTFYILRVLLGITEAGFFPGVILYLTLWIPVQFRAQINGLFYFGPPLAFILGGPFSGWLIDLHGAAGLAGWQIMFLVTGVLTVVVGVACLFYLDNGPATARFLSAEEKAVIVAAIDSEEQDKSDHSPRGALRALADWRVLYFCLIYFTIQAANYGVAFFLPSQVGAIVGDAVGLQVGLLTAVPWVGAIIATIVLTRIADRTGKRRHLATAALAAAALGLFLSVQTSNPVLALAALALAAAGFISVQPIYWTLPTSFMAGAAAASGIAMINSLGNLGGFAAPILRQAAEDAWGGQAGSYVLAAFALIGAILIWFSGHVTSAIRTIGERTSAVPVVPGTK